MGMYDNIIAKFYCPIEDKKTPHTGQFKWYENKYYPRLRTYRLTDLFPAEFAKKWTHKTKTYARLEVIWECDCCGIICEGVVWIENRRAKEFWIDSFDPGDVVLALRRTKKFTWTKRNKVKEFGMWNVKRRRKKKKR